MFSRLLILAVFCSARVAAGAGAAEDPALSPERGRMPTWHVALPTEEAERRYFAVATDARGRIVAAHGDITIHDGFVTKSLPRPGGLYTGALAIDRAGRIWAGNAAELGYYEADATGEWRFVSVREALPEAHRELEIIWAVHCVEDAVIFVESQRVLRWRDGRMEVFPLPAMRRLFSAPDGQAGMLVLQRKDHTSYRLEDGRAAGFHTCDLWQIGAQRAPQLLASDLATSAMMAVRDRESGRVLAPRNGWPLLELDELTLAGHRAAPLINQDEPHVISGVVAGKWSVWGTPTELFSTDQHGRMRFRFREPYQLGGVANAEALTLGADGRVWTVNGQGLVAVDISAAVSYYVNEGADLSIHAIARQHGRMRFGGPAGLVYPDGEPPGEIEARETPLAAYKTYGERRWLRAFATKGAYAAHGYSDGVSVEEEARLGDGSPERTYATYFAGWENRALHFARDEQGGDVLVEVSQTAVALHSVQRREVDSPHLVQRWRRGFTALEHGLLLADGRRLLIADNRGRLSLLTLRMDPVADVWAESGPTVRIGPENGLGAWLRLQLARDGRGVWLLGRAGGWFWPDDGTGQPRRIAQDVPPGLPILALAEHSDGRAWALARLPALGDGAGQSGRVLHGVWKVRAEAGRVTGMAGAPLAVVDRTGVHATDFFEPVGPAGEGAIWWLGGSQGVARVALDHLPAEGHAVPAPYLLAARDANGERLPLTGGWRLAGLRGLELDLSVAEVAQAMPLAVQTRLVDEDGAASEWSPLSRERLHRWERLAGGRFVIEARAVGASGLAGPALSVGFTVAPRFYETVWFWSAVTAALLSFAGILASYWTRRSRRRQLELERVVGERTSSLLATNEELTRQSAKRTELVSVVSHEIRSPLVGAGLLAERIAARAGEAGLAEEARQLSEQLHGLRKVLDGTLDLSRFELGLVPVRWRREHAEQFVQSTLAVHEASARKKGLGWRTDFSGLDRALLIDSVNLTRVLHNLVGNAVKYTDTGEVVVTAAYERQARALRFSVRDTGPGLPDEVASTLQSTRLRRHALGEQDAHRPSSGLGLALASRLIALGGDSLECRDARPGLELRFGVPALEAPTTRCTDGEEDFAPPYAGSVLILEDEPAQRDHACDVLEPLGLSVDLVATCAEAVKLAQARRYDLALLDFNLPDGTGLEVLLQLRAGRCAPEVIALVTAHESAPIEQACREAGATEFLAKPLTLRAAIRLLDRTARRRQAEGGQPVEMPSKAVR